LVSDHFGEQVAKMALGRMIAFGAVFGALAAPSLAEPQVAWATTDRLELVYDVAAGARIVELTLEFSVADDRYNISSRQTSVGLVRWLFPFESRTDVAGRFVAAATEPSSYRVKGEFRGKPRSVEMDFRDGALVRSQTFPENVDDERDEVTPEQRVGAVDPVSAVMAVIRQMNEGRGCDARVPVFDGRMRYDIVFKDAGQREVPREGNSVFSGMAEVCEFAWVPIAGRSRKATANRKPEDDKRTGRAFMAPLGSGQVVAPARIEFETWFGTVVGHLREVRGTAQKAAAN
jgi:hypothetical protein